MSRHLICLLLALVVMTAKAASQGDVELEVRPDVHNVTANSLVGSWERDVSLCERLGKNGADLGYEFVDDPTVLGKIEPGLRQELKEHRVYLAGWMIKHTKTSKIKRAYLLTAIAGNSTVLWFRERKGHPMGDAESFYVSVIRANDRRKDLLFIGGGFNNQSFEAFGRQKSLTAASKRAPTVSDDGDTASWVFEDAKNITLVRIDGRWYLAGR